MYIWIYITYIYILSICEGFTFLQQNHPSKKVNYHLSTIITHKRPYNTQKSPTKEPYIQWNKSYIHPKNYHYTQETLQHSKKHYKRALYINPQLSLRTRDPTTLKKALQKSPVYNETSPTYTQRSQLSLLNTWHRTRSPTYTQKSPIYNEKSPTLKEKSKLLLLHTRHPTRKH